MKKSKIKREFSAGCVVFKRLKIKEKRLKIAYLLGRHSGYHKWVLPKGLIEKGEKGPITAIRETEEEMGIKIKLISNKPIYVIKYIYAADFKKLKTQNSNVKITFQNSKLDRSTRRVMVYSENGGSKTKVFKTATFYLAEYDSGSPKNHGWEMAEAGWFSYKKAFSLLAFKGEKEALKKAKKLLLGLF